jgi:hypothetical protein
MIFSITLLEVDDSNLDKFSDPRKASFMKHFIIPEGLKILRQKLKVRSAQVIPPFDPIRSNCNDTQFNGSSTIDIRTNFHTKVTRADFLLYIGVVNDPKDTFLAYATFCVTGNKKLNFIKIIIF